MLYSTGRDLCLRGASALVVHHGQQHGAASMARRRVGCIGDHDPASWRYRATIEGPTRRLVRTLTADEVVHVRIGEDAAAPWRGVSPLAAATDTAGALAGVESGLRKEANQVSGYVLPGGGVEGLDDAAFAELKSDLAKLAGGTRIVPTLNPRVGDPSARPGRCRLGKPKAGNISTGSAGRSQKRRGPGRAQLGGNTAGVGRRRCGRHRTARRAATALPRHIAADCCGSSKPSLTRVLEVDVALDLSALAAADVQGRARAFRALVGGNNQNGIEIAEARRLTGL